MKSHYHLSFILHSIYFHLIKGEFFQKSILKDYLTMHLPCWSCVWL